MAHTRENKKKILDRIRRIRGQLNGLEKAVEEERECGEVLLTLAAARGAMDSLMLEILEGHVREHVLAPNPSPREANAAEELIEVLRRYLK